MADYCTVADVQLILPKTIIIGDNILRGGANATTSNVESWITRSSEELDSHLSAFYRIPLITYKQADFSANPITFTEMYPPPIVLITSRLAAAHIYDNIMMAGQEPNVSEWGKNQRSLAFDDIKMIQAGVIQLRNQVRTGYRFVRTELFDHSRVSIKPATEPNTRQAGQ
jgi:hypothetical protein